MKLTLADLALNDLHVRAARVRGGLMSSSTWKLLCGIGHVIGMNDGSTCGSPPPQDVED